MGGKIAFDIANSFALGLDGLGRDETLAQVNELTVGLLNREPHTLGLFLGGNQAALSHIAFIFKLRQKRGGIMGQRLFTRRQSIPRALL